MNQGGVQLIGPALWREVLERARQSPRRRMNHNFHRSLAENPNRFLNVMLEGTYVRPHRHIDPPKAEAFVVLEGQVAFFVFDDRGQVTGWHRLGRENGEDAAPGIDLAPGIWHTLAVLTPHAVIYEVKPGPYAKASDKDFAPWAPEEGTPEAGEYLEGLLCLAGRR